MNKAFLIDTANREVREAEYQTNVACSDPKSLQTLIGGYIETAWSNEQGDNLFVDEEGLFKPQQHFFVWALRRDGVPLAGNGVIVGREVEHDCDYHTEPPSLDIETVRACVRFFDRSQVDAWAKANASEPASTITFMGQDGRPHTEVTDRVGTLYGDMPRPHDED
jgi:hypothetical protein